VKVDVTKGKYAGSGSGLRYANAVEPFEAQHLQYQAATYFSFINSLHGIFIRHDSAEPSQLGWNQSTISALNRNVPAPRLLISEKHKVTQQWALRRPSHEPSSQGIVVAFDVVSDDV
jgi:hypothetical protein